MPSPCSNRSSVPTRRRERAGCWEATTARNPSEPSRALEPRRRWADRVGAPRSVRDSRLSLAKAGGKRLEQRPGHLRVLLDEGAKLPGGHAAAAHVGGGSDGGRARPLVDQRDLPDVLSGAHGAQDLALEADGGVPVLDHEEADP